MSCERRERSSREETYRLIDEAKNGNTAAKERLIEENTGLVSMAARRFAASGQDMDDMMQLGYIGLIKAIDRFDASYGVMFSTYAVPMIAGEIRRFLRDDGRIKISRQLKQDVKLLKRVEEEFLQKHGRSPRISELAAAMGRSADDISEMLEARTAITATASMDDEAFAASGLQEPASDDEADDETRRVEIMDMRDMLMRLGEKERSVIIMRYFRDMTQQQTGDRLGISQVQVSRIEKRALKTMRERMRR